MLLACGVSTSTYLAQIERLFPLASQAEIETPQAKACGV